LALKGLELFLFRGLKAAIYFIPVQRTAPDWGKMQLS